MDEWVVWCHSGVWTLPVHPDRDVETGSVSIDVVSYSETVEVPEGFRSHSLKWQTGKGGVRCDRLRSDSIGTVDGGPGVLRLTLSLYEF